MFKLICKFGDKYSVLDTSDNIIENVYLCDIIYTIVSGFTIIGVKVVDNFIFIDDYRIEFKSSSKKLIVGKRLMMNCGMYATVIEDFGASHINIQFDDGVIKSCTRQLFNNGYVGHPYYSSKTYKKSIIEDSILGQRRLMNCGYYCTVIEYISSTNITVEFDDGSKVHKRSMVNFNTGSILHPSLKNKSILGMSRKMNCGLIATVIEDSGTNDISVRFEDGTVINKRSRKDFKDGNIAPRRNYSHLKSCLGDRRQMRNGLWVEVVRYNSSRDLDVRFDIDGYIAEHRCKKDFIVGNIGHPSYSSHNLTSALGEIRLMNCGLTAEVIADRCVDDIDVRFSDGLIVSNRHRYEFFNGTICHPDYRPKKRNSLLGVSNRMRNGLIATVVRDNGVFDIDCIFEDGYMVHNISRVVFRNGYIKHPNYTLSSLPELLVYRYIYSYFKDAVHNFRPDWLKNNMTGRNLEIDIWIPSLKVGIEYDGFGFHNCETSLSKLKYDLIVNSTNIDKLYTLLEPDCIVHNSVKHNNIMLSNKSNSINFLQDSLQPAIEKLLYDLGVQRKVDFNNDFEFTGVRGDVF